MGDNEMSNLGENRARFPSCIQQQQPTSSTHFVLSFQHPRVTKREKILMMPSPSSKVTFPQRRSCRGCPSCLLLGCGSHLKDSRNLLHRFPPSSEKDVITITLRIDGRIHEALSGTANFMLSSLSEWRKGIGFLFMEGIMQVAPPQGRHKCNWLIKTAFYVYWACWSIMCRVGVWRSSLVVRGALSVLMGCALEVSGSRKEWIESFKHTVRHEPYQK